MVQEKNNVYIFQGTLIYISVLQFQIYHVLKLWIKY
jgi:hypothetical protein